MVNLDVVVLTVGAFLGSLKAATEFGKAKSRLVVCVDVLVGTFCGLAVAFHFHNTDSKALSALLALVGGVSGALVLEVCMRMVPSVARRFIQAWVASYTTK